MPSREDKDGKLDEEGRTFLDRLTVLVKLHCYPPEMRAAAVREMGLTLEQVEAWRLEARRVLKHLPGLKRKRSE